MTFLPCNRTILLSLCSLLATVLPQVHCWSPPQIVSTQNRMRTHAPIVRLLAESSDRSESTNTLDTHGKTIYQRVFYYLDPESTVDIADSVVVEERVRFEPDADPERQSQGYIQPIGPRTLILRDGSQIQDGVFGKAFVTLDVHEHRDGIKIHSGAGLDTAMDASIAMVLYLASSPTLFQGRVMELSSNLGVSGLLGSLGAGFVLKGGVGAAESLQPPDDILSIPSGSPWLPDSLESLTLTDPDDERLYYIMENAKNLGVSANKVFLDKLDWSVRDARPSGSAKDYRTIIAGDVAYSFPEAKMLARAVAYRLEPSYSHVGSAAVAPRFVHIYPDGSDQNVYLRRFLERVSMRGSSFANGLEFPCLFVLTAPVAFQSGLSHERVARLSKNGKDLVCLSDTSSW